MFEIMIACHPSTVIRVEEVRGRGAPTSLRRKSREANIGINQSDSNFLSFGYISRYDSNLHFYIAVLYASALLRVLLAKQT
jgi:hypothetical protein